MLTSLFLPLFSDTRYIVRTVLIDHYLYERITANFTAEWSQYQTCMAFHLPPSRRWKSGSDATTATAGTFSTNLSVFKCVITLIHLVHLWQAATLTFLLQGPSNHSTYAESQKLVCRAQNMINTFSYSLSYQLWNPKFSNIDCATPSSCKQNNALLCLWQKTIWKRSKKPF